MMNVTEREYSLTAASERGFVRDVKEKLRYFGADYDTVHHSTAEMDIEKTSKPPDKNFITVGAERFLMRETVVPAKFHPRVPRRLGNASS